MEEKKRGKKEERAGPEAVTMPMKRRIQHAAIVSIWVVAGFFVASFLVGFVVSLLIDVKVITSAMNLTVLLSMAAVIIYLVSIAIIIGIPAKFYGIRTTRKEVGLDRSVSWTDLLLAPASFVIYMIVAGVLLAAIQSSFPGFNVEEPQEIGFKNLGSYYEYALAFFTLVIAAPVAEELLMRGYLYGKLRKVMSVAGAVVLSAVLFSALHLSFSNEQGEFAIGQWNVAIGLLPLGIILAILREQTGSIWAGVLLHALKNGVAFYFLFIDPNFLDTIGK